MPGATSETVIAPARTSPLVLVPRPSSWAPLPRVVRILVTSGWPAMIRRAAAAAALVSASGVPGGSSKLIVDCERSLAGMKPFGSSGASAIEPRKRPTPERIESLRWARPQRTNARYLRISGPSSSTWPCGFSR